MEKSNKSAMTKLGNAFRKTYQLKLIMLGQLGVGKTALVHRFVKNHFLQDYEATVGVNFKFRTVKHEKKNIKFACK